jgi:hypothetical protein
MKKILTVVALSLLLFSCSNESEVAKEVSINKSTFAKEGDADLDKLYDNMVKSEAYINYESLQKDFIAKVNFKGNVSEVDTNEKLLTWISDNLSQTSFVNIEEAEGQSENLKLAFYKVYVENEIFFKGIINSNDTKSLLIHYLHLPTLPGDQVVFGDPCECKADFDFAINQAKNAYTLTISTAKSKYLAKTLSGAGLSKAISDAYNVFSISCTTAADTYRDCTLNCKK